jgi:hypothetical protein
MATPDRSLDDMPLAAYSTGVEPDPRLDEPAEVPTAVTPDPAAVPPPGPRFVMSRAEPVELPADPQGLAAPQRIEAPRTGPTAAVLELARRNPRIAAGAGFVAVILVGLVLLGASGQAPASLAASASPTAPAVVVILPPTGDATLVLTGGVQGTYAFGGGALDAVRTGAFSATWTNATQDTLSLDAKVDRGTRTTDAGLVLRMTVMVAGAPVTFTSKAGECTVGMGVQPTTVTGSFSCKKLKSDDGKLVVDARGTYRT